MSRNRHAYIPFYPSDWLGGTAGMTPHQKLVYFELCVYIWDKAEPVPEKKLPILLGLIPNWEQTLNELVDAEKLTRKDGTITNERALAEAAKAYGLWKKKSEGGRQGAEKTNTGDGTPGKTPERTDNGTPDRSGGAYRDSRRRTRTKNQNNTPPKSPPGVKKDFEEFYSEFPNKRGGPDDALKAYRAARRRAGHRQIMAGLMAYKENKEDWRAWKQAGPWLRAGMWKAEYGSPQSNGKPPEDWTADEWRKFLGKPDSWMAKRVKDYWPVRGRNFPDGAPKEILKEYGWE